jgi:carboxypeptidase family protein/TonB-dependent receptor-like protein
MKIDHKQMRLPIAQYPRFPLSTSSIQIVTGCVMRLAMAAFCVCIIILLGQRTGWAQQTSATLVGTLTDANGAVVTNAQIKVANMATGSARAAVSDGNGNYSFTFLPAGEYELTISAPGYKTRRIVRLTLQVSQTLRQDFTMEIGEVNEMVNITATGVQLQTENSTVGTVIDSEKIVELPLNGRNFVQLAQLIPGVQSGTPGSITVRRGRGSIGQSDAAFASTAMSANGSRDTANRFFIDGIEAMDHDAETFSFSPSIDSLAEFKVETSTYSAESGGAPGGQVNIVTKRGGNQYHGTLWEFNRNDALTQSYDAIAGKTVDPPRLNRNQFGANFGGPVKLPRFGEGGPPFYDGKDRTFFFFNWESGRLAQGAVPGLRRVPTAEMRNGDFRGLVDRNGKPITLRDPLGAGIVDNVIPRSALSPQIQTFLKFVPSPNTSAGALNFINAPQSAISRQDNYTARVDHNFSTKDSVSGRYIFNDTYEAGIPFWGHDERNNLGRSQNISSSWTHTFGAALVNELRGGWHKFSEFEIFGTTNDPDFDVAGMMGLPGIAREPVHYGPPSISISGDDGVWNVYDLQRQIGPRNRSNQIFQFVDTLSWQRGKHFLKLGADIELRNITFDQSRDPRGSIGFDGTYTGSALADFMLGYVKTSRLNPVFTHTDLWNWWYSFFVNDDFKIKPNLTINLGLRYDYFQRPVQSNDLYANIEVNGLIPAATTFPSTSRFGRSLIARDGNNFGPRIGLAWSPGFVKDAVVRGGYGIYYTPEIYNAYFAMAEGAQATGGASLTGNLSGVPDIFMSNPYGTSVAGALSFTVANDQSMRDSYIQQWNLNIQKRLPASIVFDVGYVGSKGTRLIVTLPGNQPIQLVDPRTTGIPSLNNRRPNTAYPRQMSLDKSTGNSIYHALQVKAERRLVTGLTFLTAYTWSKAITGPADIGGQVGGGFFIGGVQDLYNLAAERSLSGFDLTHRFVQTVIYDVPFFRNTKGAARFLLDGWQASTILTLQSGFPAAINDNADTTGVGRASRPDMVAGQSGNLPESERTWQRWFNTSAFVRAPFGRFGNSPRTGAIRLPGFFNTDFSVNKRFSLGETRSFEFRAEIFNLFNHFNPDPQTVDLNLQSPTFGSIGGGAQGVTTRIIQLGAKFYF